MKNLTLMPILAILVALLIVFSGIMAKEFDRKEPYFNVYASEASLRGNMVLIGVLEFDEREKTYRFSPLSADVIKEIQGIQWSFDVRHQGTYTFKSTQEGIDQLSDLLAADLDLLPHQQVLGSLTLDGPANRKELHNIVLIRGNSGDVELRLVRNFEIQTSILLKHVLVIRKTNLRSD